MVEISGHREAQVVFESLRRKKQEEDEWLSNYVRNRIVELLDAQLRKYGIEGEDTLEQIQQKVGVARKAEWIYKRLRAKNI